MDRKMRRSKQQLTDKESVEILRAATSGVLALCGTDNRPYGVPLSHVYNDGKLYFHSALNGLKLDLIRQNEKACFTVIAQDEIHPESYTTFFRSVIVYGNIRIITDANEKRDALTALGLRCNPDDSEGLAKEIENGLTRCNALELRIEKITGKQAIELVSKPVR